MHGKYEMWIIEFDKDEVFALNKGSQDDGDSYDSVPGGGTEFSDV